MKSAALNLPVRPSSYLLTPGAVPRCNLVACARELERVPGAGTFLEM